MRGAPKTLLFKLPLVVALVAYGCSSGPVSDSNSNNENRQRKITEIDTRKDDSVIRWTEDYELSWSDFRKPIDGTEEFDAVVKTGLIYRFNSNTKEYLITVYAVMAKDSSYANKDVRKDSATLAHESGHFDLAEIRAREVRKKVSQWNGSGNIEEFLKDCADAAYVVNGQRQDAYDIETAHGTVESAQKQWYRKIDSLLSSLDSFSDPIVRVKPTDSKAK